MRVADILLKKIKRALYEWVSVISVKQLGTNKELQKHIEIMCKKLNSVPVTN